MPSQDTIAFRADLDRLRHLDPAIGHDDDVAVEFEYALIGK